MKPQTRNTISFITALFGTISSVFLVSVFIPGSGWQKWALVAGEAFLATSRLYLFYEGTALNEVSNQKARIAFRLSVIMSIALCGYGIAIYKVNSEFTDYALALFLVMQMGIAFTEWVFSTRTGEKVNTQLFALESQIESLETELKASESKFETSTGVIEAHESKITSLQTKVDQQEKKIEELDLASEVHTKELARVNDQLSNFKTKVSIVQSVGKNMRVCYCGECGEFNSWGIANKAPVCVKCKIQLQS